VGQLKGKTALLTGRSRGIGMGIMRALVAEGAITVALARNATRLEQLKHEVAGVQTRVADVADPQTTPMTLRATIATRRMDA
jgi:NAD(P)-dependent dehydrogenase (short-subunit alcohol dehydrogenase family)